MWFGHSGDRWGRENTQSRKALSLQEAPRGSRREGRFTEAPRCELGMLVQSTEEGVRARRQWAATPQRNVPLHGRTQLPRRTPNHLPHRGIARLSACNMQSLHSRNGSREHKSREEIGQHTLRWISALYMALPKFSSARLDPKPQHHTDDQKTTPKQKLEEKRRSIPKRYTSQAQLLHNS